MDAPLTQPGRLDLPLQRPQPDHPRRPARAADAARPLDAVVARAHHRAARHARHRLQPDATATADRRHGVPVHPGPRHGLGRGPRRERLVARRRRRATRASSRPPHDLAVLAQALLNGGTYRGQRILSRTSVEPLITNFNQAFPGDAHGLGFELDQRWYMDALSGPRTAGHTGYTGTSIVIDFASRSFAILLTNRVHPSRDWGSNNPARREWAQGLALRPGRPAAAGRHGLVLPVPTRRPPPSRTTAPLDVPASGARLASTSSSTPRRPTCCTSRRRPTAAPPGTPVPFAVRDRGETHGDRRRDRRQRHRRWPQARADLPAGPPAAALALHDRRRLPRPRRVRRRHPGARAPAASCSTARGHPRRFSVGRLGGRRAGEAVA